MNLHEVIATAHHPHRVRVMQLLGALYALTVLAALLVGSLVGYAPPGPEPEEVDLGHCEVAVIAADCRAALPPELQDLPRAETTADRLAWQRLPPVEVGRRRPRWAPLPSTKVVLSGLEPDYLKREGELIGVDPIPPYHPTVITVEGPVCEDYDPEWYAFCLAFLAPDPAAQAAHLEREIQRRLGWRAEVLANELEAREEVLPFLWTGTERRAAARHAEWAADAWRAEKSRRIEPVLPAIAFGVGLPWLLVLWAWRQTRPLELVVTPHTLTWAGRRVPIHEVVSWDGTKLELASGEVWSLESREVVLAERVALHEAIHTGASTPREDREAARQAIDGLRGIR